MLRNITITIIYTLLISNTAISQATEYGGYWQCITQSLPELLFKPRVRRMTIGSLDCFELDQIETVKGIAATTQNRQNDVCRAYANLTESCRDYLTSCNNDYTACQAALENTMNCIPYLSEANTLLKSAGVDTPKRLIDSTLKFRQQAQFCVEGTEYVEKKPPLWWDRFCNDYNLGPISFYELNEYYYESGQRAELLRRYAMAEPATDSWKRLIVTMMGLESLDSEDANERAAAAKVLGPHGDFSTPIMYKLLSALDDSEPGVRANAALSLRVQGNRKSLVVISLLSKLLDTDETPEVRGNAALALREQATNYPCKSHEEARYRLDGSENPNDLVSGVPTCVPYDQAAHDRAEKEEDWWGEESQEKERCDTPFANLFDRIAKIKDFNIIDNLCYVGVKMRQSKIRPIVKQALLVALQAEDDPVARAKMVAAMRNIGKPVKGDDTILQLLRFQYLTDTDYRVRRAAIFALARAAKDEDWLLKEVIPQALQDESASVRKAAIAAASELIVLSMSKKDTAYQAYVNGMTFHNSQATDCQSSAKTDPKESTPAGRIESKFYTEGYKAAYLFYQDKCGESGKPVLAFSKPAMGAQNVSRRTDIALHFLAPVAKGMITSKVRLYGPKKAVIPYTIKEYKLTSVVLKIAEPLAPDQYYQLKFIEGFKSMDAPDGYDFSRSLLFKTVSSKVSEIIAAMMTDDPDVDVQYAAAEAFIARNENAVLDFMKNKLLQNPPRNKVRAATYLGSPYFTYGSIAPDERLSFMIDILGKIKAHIVKHERGTNPPAEAYLITPALGQYYNLMQELLSKSWVTRDMKKKIDEALNIRQWILEKLKKDFPLRAYSYYERIYYAGIRNTLKTIVNRHFMLKQNVDYVIYEDILMSE
ncbi:MAG: HEAT repeat domain-containing protein [Pseudomonadota bacterium]